MSDKEKIAPVQGYAAGIPWSMHLRAYDAYCKKYGPQEALIDLEGRYCRGGFGTGELDMFIPGWREELSELTRLKAALDKALVREVKQIEVLLKLKGMMGAPDCPAALLIDAALGDQQTEAAPTQSSDRQD